MFQFCINRNVPINTEIEIVIDIFLRGALSLHCTLWANFS